MEAREASDENSSEGSTGFLVDDLGPTLGRREALGLSLFGALGTSMVASWVVNGDTAPVVANGVRSGQLAEQAIAVRAAHRQNAQQARTEPIRVQTVPRPVTTVHDLIPTAPERAVALTIDDGPDPTWTPQVLDLLAHHEVAATFCLVGVQVRQYPELVRGIIEAGHQVANHTMHHPINFGSLSGRRLDAEIGAAHKEIHEVTGQAPKLFRAPGGSWSRKVLKSVTKHGMLPLDWDVDPRDWSCPGTKHITRTLLRAKPGDILLCHDGGGDRSETLRSLRTVIPRLKKRDLEFVTL